MGVDIQNVFVKNKFEKLNMNIDPNSIIAIIGEKNKKYIIDLLIGTCKIDAGKIIIDDIELTNYNYKKEKDKMRQKVGALFNDVNKYRIEDNVQQQLNLAFLYCEYPNYEKINKMKEALKIVGLSDDYLTKLMVNLTIVEKKLVFLASLIIFNPEIIILDEYEKHLNFSDIEMVKNILKDLKKRYNKTIIIITNNAKFIMNFVNQIFVFENNSIELIKDHSYIFDKEIKKYIDIPEIINFSHLVNDKGYNFKYYNDVLDVIKAVYRDVS